MIARAVAVPRDALLQRHVGPGAYTDCFEAMSPFEVDLEAFIGAFYTTWLFRLERVVLSLVLRRWIRDREVAALAEGGDAFAVWRVEARGAHQILLRETSGLTRSYLAVSAKEGGVTRLLFGSAVVGPQGRVLRAMIPAHRLYSKALLRLAERKLRTR